MYQMNVLWAYLVYLPVVLLLTFFVTSRLFSNAIVYFMDIFRGRREIAVATNQLFKIGFYLINMGFALYILEIHQTELTVNAAFEVLSTKIGGFSIYLGVMLLLNMLLFFRGKKAAGRRRLEEAKPGGSVYS